MTSQPTETPLQQERRRQVRGLLWLALIVAAASLLRTTLHGELRHLIFTPHWWHIW